jgi:hypothetical protein
MARCPFAVWEPSPNTGGRLASAIGVVIHVSAGESDPGGWFADPLSQVSAHFGIGNGQGGFGDGDLRQYVDTDIVAWAEAAGNTHYISVETEGQPSEALTVAQVVTFGRLYAWLHQLYGIPFTITDTPGRPGFITHGDGGAAWGNHPGCPGSLRAAQRAAVLAWARAAVPVPPATPPGGDTMQDLTVVTEPFGGGTLPDGTVVPAGGVVKSAYGVGKDGNTYTSWQTHPGSAWTAWQPFGGTAP